MEELKDFNATEFDEMVNRVCPEEEGKSAPKNVLTVYKKKSTFKGAKDTDFWYSATRSDGNAVNLVFKCPVLTDSMAFEVYNVIGTLKRKTIEKSGTTYINYTYYITSCEFREIIGEELPL